MYTKCPDCNKLYKISVDTLKIAHGFVRCGVCKNPFNAIPHLSERVTTKVPPPKSISVNTNTEYSVKEVLAKLQELQKKEELPTYWYTKKKARLTWFTAAKAALASTMLVYAKPAIDNNLKDAKPDAAPPPPPELPDSPKEQILTESTVLSTADHNAAAQPPEVQQKTAEEKPIVADPVDEEDPQPKIILDGRSTEELLQEAKTALLNRSFDQAILDLRSIILKEPIANAREANELLGYAYEKSRLPEKAMRQYARYLALYPDDNEDRQRVRQRLMSLEILVPKETIGQINKTKTPRTGDRFTSSGAVSEYVYVDSSGSSKPQVESITGIQFSASQEHNQYTLSTRVRLTEIKDLSNPSGNRTNLSTAYVSLEDTYAGYNVKAGRQNAVAGAMGKFDGVSGKYEINDNVKVTAAAGKTYTPSSTTKREFVGTQLDWKLNDDWLVGTYLNRGVADRLLERMAVGGVLEYRSKNNSSLLTTEYDTVYHSWNQITFQQMSYYGKYSFFALLDRRKSPLPYGDVALSLSGFGIDKQSYSSVGDLLTKSGLTTSEIYSYIKGSTPTATSYVAGVSKNFNRDTLGTVNFQLTNLSTLPGFNLNPKFDPIPIQVGMSKNYSLNFHLRQDNFMFKNNTTEFVLNGSTGSMKSNFATIADSYKLNTKSRDIASVILRYDAYDPGYGQVRTFSGVLRGIHGIGERGSIEAQYSKSLTISKDFSKLGQLPNNSGQNFYIGFRYDF